MCRLCRRDGPFPLRRIGWGCVLGSDSGPKPTPTLIEANHEKTDTSHAKWGKRLARARPKQSCGIGWIETCESQENDYPVQATQFDENGLNLLTRGSRTIYH